MYDDVGTAWDKGLYFEDFEFRAMGFYDGIMFYDSPSYDYEFSDFEYEYVEREEESNDDRYAPEEEADRDYTDTEL